MKMGKSKTAKTVPNKVAKTTGVELNETQLDQAAGGLIGLLKKDKLLPAV
jgi:hypothetical protein